ncbi:enoyl-CoA hydratase/isomerase family protein [Blastococcus sp. SYSU D00820]
MGSYRHLRIEVADGVAEVTIDRPHRLNTLDSAAHEEMERLWPDLQERDDVAAVVLTGAGGVFSAGGDVKDMLAFAAEHPGEGSGISIARARRLVYGLLDLEKPVVAAVEGRAFGLGATIALLCDLVVTARGARFSDAHVDLGLVPGDGGAAVWTVLAGPHRARDLLLRGREIDADEIAALGIATEVCEPGQALARAHAVTAEILRRPPLAVRGTKVAVNAWVKAQFAGVFETALAWEVASLRSADFAEGVAALGEKRPPRFTGR